MWKKALDELILSSNKILCLEHNYLMDPMGKQKCVFIVFIYSDQKHTQADGMQIAQHEQKPSIVL